MVGWGYLDKKKKWIRYREKLMRGDVFVWVNISGGDLTLNIKKCRNKVK